MTDIEIGVIGSVALLTLILLGIRVIYAASLVGLIGLVMLVGWSAGANNAGMIPFTMGSYYSLSVLPLFILIGYLAFYAGITRSLFDMARAWIGWVPGGLAVATIFASAGFAAVSGSSTATAAVFGRVAIPSMLEAKYDPRLAAGVVAAAGTLSVLIPPSAILVLYAIMVEQPIGPMLVAGVIPGALSALIWAVMIIGMAWRKPQMAMPIRGYSWRERLQTAPGVLPILIVISIIFSAVYFGWATVTEAGAVGAFVVLVLAFLKKMKWPDLRQALHETAKLTVMIFALVWSIQIFVRFLGFSGMPEAIADSIASLNVPRIVILLLILGLYLILGMFMDGVGMLVLTLPIVYPVILALGYDPIWFGIILVKMIEICMITPPVGLNCFVVAGVQSDIPISNVFKGTIPFFFGELIMVGIFISFPDIVLWLPDLMYN